MADFDVSRHLAGRAGRHVAVDGHFARQVAPVDLVGTGGLPDHGHLVQAHHARAAIGIGTQRERNALQILGRDCVPRARAARSRHRSGRRGRASCPRFDPPPGHATHCQSAQPQTQVGGCFAVNFHVQRGLVGFDAGVQVHQARNRPHFLSTKLSGAPVPECRPLQ
jgi:hypothetical protein